jgi:hypothetical protein
MNGHKTLIGRLVSALSESFLCAGVLALLDFTPDGTGKPTPSVAVAIVMTWPFSSSASSTAALASPSENG